MPTHLRTNHTIPCTSPLIKWFPAKEQGPIWNLTYTDSSWSDYRPNTRGSGRPGHSSSLNGSRVEFGWKGGDVWFYGQGGKGESAGGAGYEVVCDEERSRAYVVGNDAGKLLGGCRGLSEREHSARLVLDGSETIELWRITWESALAGSGSKVVNNTAQAIQDDGSLNPFFTSSRDSWEPRLNMFGSEDNSPSPQILYPRITTSTPNALINFQIPSRSTAVYIIGAINHDHSSFAVQVGDGKEGRGVFSGKSSWGDIEQVLFYSELDPDVETGLLVTNLGTNGSTSFDISKVIWVTVEGKAKSTLSIGAIVGIAIGGMIGIGLIAFAVGLFIKYRKRKAQEERRRTWGEVDLTDGQLEDATGNKNGVDHSPQPIQPFMPGVGGMDSSATSPKGSRNQLLERSRDPSHTTATYRDDDITSDHIGYDSNALYNPHFTANPNIASTGERSPTTTRPVVNALHVQQETDAGPLPLEMIIPPRYDNSWQAGSSRRPSK